MTIERIERKPADEERLRKLRELFPEVWSDGRVNVERLRELLDGEAEELAPGDEHYGLNWPGKQEARKQASKPASGTLRPAPGEGVNENDTQNLLIVGDNLEVLRTLQKSYAGRVKLIYLDPPYNTGNDLIYNDDFSDPVSAYLEATGQTDLEGLLTSNPKSSGRFHSKWLTMMRPRLVLARSLLREDGLLFASIDDREVCHLRMLLNDIFGEENFISEIVVQSNKRGQTYKEISQTHEYLLVFAKGDEATIFELAKVDDSLPYTDSRGKYDLWELRNRNPKFGRHNRPNLYFPIYVAPSVTDESGYSKICLNSSDTFGVKILPKNSEGEESCWRWGKPKIAETDTTSGCPVLVAKQKKNGDWNIYEKSRKSTTKAKSLWVETEVISEQGTIELGELGLADCFDHPKPLGLLRKILLLGTEPGDLVVDLFAGSGSSGDAVMRLNGEDGGGRRFILVQLPEPTNRSEYLTIADVTKERLRRASDVVRAKAAGELSLTTLRPGDVGFRVLYEARSSVQRFLPIEGASATELPQLFRSGDGLVSGWKVNDLLVEVMLIEGYPLDAARIQSPAFTENVVYLIEHPTIPARLLICLEAEIADGTIESLREFKDDVFVCLESALTDTFKVRIVDALSRVRTL